LGRLAVAFGLQNDLPMRKKSKPRSSSNKLGPRSTGDADNGDGKEPDVDSLLLVNSVFSLRLLRAYTAIKDKAVRRKLVILVEMIAASQR
jgi:hypothetical protein